MTSDHNRDPANRDHLTTEEVLQIISFVAESEPIIVGGQSINLWAQYYRSDPELTKLGPLVSNDVDFFDNDAAIQQLASRLTKGEVRKPAIDDATPNSAVIRGMLGDRNVEIDFMASILGVPSSSITRNFVSLQDAATINGQRIKLRLMNPLDCVRSRLANINTLKRTDTRSITQAIASIIVLDNYVNDLLEQKITREAQRTLKAIAYTYRDHHVGKASHIRFDKQLNFNALFAKYASDNRLDERWRNLQFQKLIDEGQRRALRAAQIAAKRKKDFRRSRTLITKSDQNTPMKNLVASLAVYKVKIAMSNKMDPDKETSPPLIGIPRPTQKLGSTRKSTR